jgi:hypothetical protein
MVTFDIKDLYVNIPIDDTINLTKTLLTNKKIDNILIEQACTLLKTILKQNYLYFNGKFYQPNKGVAYGLTHIRIDSRNIPTTLRKPYHKKHP